MKILKLKEQIEKYIPYNEQEVSDKELMLEYIDKFEDVLTRKNKMCHFTASNWIVNKDRTKVLMIYHNIYKSWVWTGGHADGDSDLLHVAIKEAEEETGLNNLKLLSDGIYGLQILTVDSHIKRGKFVSSHLHLDCCFLLEANEEEKLRIKEDENSGVKWVEIYKATKLTNEEMMKSIYAKLNSKLKTIKTQDWYGKIISKTLKNNYNFDIVQLRIGIGIAMGNTLQEVKKQSKEITLSNDNDGIT